MAEVWGAPPTLTSWVAVRCSWCARRGIMSKATCLFTFLKIAQESSQTVVLCDWMIGQPILGSENALGGLRGLRRPLF
eukprot:5560743-Prymnesium_polylepis.1